MPRSTGWRFGISRYSELTALSGPDGHWPSIVYGRLKLRSPCNPEAREHLERLEAATKAREETARLKELKQRLSGAEDSRNRLEECKAELALLELPVSAVDELQVLDIEIAKLQAAEAATRPIDEIGKILNFFNYLIKW